ncbi:hypothetical protein B0T10DRAFT_553179 [Thelonectria olida]|uniref:Uncharacterized protein n=1 Tax=Thelonectria olida TaxID=1576542 RepID=A0A9P9AKS6_9HYPO|nr:hypothetical protein B0T10DRAFT_553179 [Thelonectria olida]
MHSMEPDVLRTNRGSDRLSCGQTEYFIVTCTIEERYLLDTRGGFPAQKDAAPGEAVISEIVYGKLQVRPKDSIIMLPRPSILEVRHIAALPTRDTLGDFGGSLFETFLRPYFQPLASEDKPCLVHWGDHFNIEAEGRQIQFKIVDMCGPEPEPGDKSRLYGKPVEGEPGTRIKNQLPFHPAPPCPPPAPASSNETIPASETDETVENTSRRCSGRTGASDDFAEHMYRPDQYAVLSNRRQLTLHEQQQSNHYI